MWWYTGTMDTFITHNSEKSNVFPYHIPQFWITHDIPKKVFLRWQSGIMRGNLLTFFTLCYLVAQLVKWVWGRLNWLESIGSGQFAKWLQQQWILSKCKKPCKLSGRVVWSALDSSTYSICITIYQYTKESNKLDLPAEFSWKTSFHLARCFPRHHSTISNPTFGEGIANNFSVW